MADERSDGVTPRDGGAAAGRRPTLSARLSILLIGGLALLGIALMCGVVFAAIAWRS